MDMFVSEFVPMIDSLYRTVPDRSHRSLIGYSMGGFGAMVLAEKHPEMFSCSIPLSMSFRTDEQYIAESQSGWDGQWGKIFGGISQSGEGRLTEYYKLHCPFYQFIPDNHEKLSQVNWMFFCGDDEDQILLALDKLHLQLQTNSFDHHYRVVDGGHSTTVWNDALLEALPFCDYNMNGASQWPQCSAPSFTRQSVTFEDDGSAKAAGFNPNDNTTAVFVFHKGLEDDVVKDIVRVAFTTSSKKNNIYLPCDLTLRSVEDWVSHYNDSYGFGWRIALCAGAAGSDVFKSQCAFNSMVFADCDLGSESIIADPCISYYFCCTENSPASASLSALYTSCKSCGATFEYRVIADCENDAILKCTDKLKTYINH